MNVRVITDSACDMLAETREAGAVEVLPLYVLQGEKTFRDGIDITPQTLYTNMRRGIIYKTAQVTYNDFLTCFTKYAEAGEPFICLPFSSGLSGTYQAATLALKDLKEKYPDAPMAVIDTKAVTGGLGLIVEKVAAEAAQGASLDRLVTLAEFYSAHIRHVFTVMDLEYLYRGGRLNKGTALIGNMLKLKPLLDVDEKGELRQLEIIRGEKKLIKHMIEYIEKNSDRLAEQTIAITHADNVELMKHFVETAGRRWHTDRFNIMPLAPIIGTHSGPGILAVFFFDALFED